MHYNGQTSETMSRGKMTKRNKGHFLTCLMAPQRFQQVLQKVGLKSPPYQPTSITIPRDLFKGAAVAYQQRGGGQGEECPQTLLTGKFLLTYRKREGRKKGKMGKKTSKKGRYEIENGRWKVTKWGDSVFCGPPAMLEGPLSFHLSRCLYGCTDVMYICMYWCRFLVKIKR